MAIAEMRKLNLVALSYDKDKILNSLQRTGAVEVKTHVAVEGLAPVQENCDQLDARLASAEAALGILSAAVDSYDKANKIKSDILKDGFDVSFSLFMKMGGKRQHMEGVIAQINALFDQKNNLNNTLSRCERDIKTAEIYSTVNLPLSTFKNSQHTAVKLGTIPSAESGRVVEQIEDMPLACCQILATNEQNCLLLAVVHKSVVAQAEEVLATCSFATCPYTGEESGKQIYDELCAERERVKNDLQQNQTQMYALKDEVKNLKVYCDNIAFEREKVQLGEKLLTTQKTFLLEAYVPSGAEQSVGEALDDVTSAIYYEFSDVPADEMPPTLMRNNKVLSNFETITNMYSPPNARELDPTTIMSFFYSLFLGFIMGDAGYGILMLVGGWLLYKKSSPHSGIKSLAGVFAIGGIFAIVWGLLFNSVFGLSLPFLPTLMPDAQSDMWSLAGIKVPAVLVISLIIGTVQLFAGYVCSAVQSFRRGKILDGICGGLTWAVFSVGVILAIIGFVEEANAYMLVQVGAIIAAVGLVAAILTAGRGQKFFAKFTKGFGAAYGVINYASDVLSYARLYGLMLSGAVIAKIVSQYSVQFMTSGNFALIILGIVLMLAGHLFNLAMSLLSAYIHDARLQYVEFYGRFFEGEGELFAPLGSSHKYIYIQ